MMRIQRWSATEEYGVDLEWPWRGTAFDGAELLVTCSLPARRCGRPPSLLLRSLSREPSDSSLNVSAISVSASLASSLYHLLNFVSR